jgi:hypothetical protein
MTPPILIGLGGRGNEVNMYKANYRLKIINRKQVILNHNQINRMNAH